MRFAVFLRVSATLLLKLLVVNVKSRVLLRLARLLDYLLGGVRVRRRTPLFLLLALFAAFLLSLDYLSLARQILDCLVHLELGIPIVLLEDLLLLLGCAIELFLLLNSRKLHLLLGWLDVRRLVPASAFLLLRCGIGLRGLRWRPLIVI